MVLTSLLPAMAMPSMLHIYSLDECAVDLSASACFRFCFLLQFFPLLSQALNFFLLFPGSLFSGLSDHQSWTEITLSLFTDDLQLLWPLPVPTLYIAVFFVNAVGFIRCKQSKSILTHNPNITYTSPILPLSQRYPM